MSAKWKWNATNVYVTDEDVSRELKRAELFVLDATESVYHFFGSGSKKFALKGVVIGDTDLNTLINDAIANTPRTLTTPWGTVSNTRINGTPKFTAIKYAGGVFDGVAYSVETTPIYNVELEIITN